MKPFIHAKSSAKKFGGVSTDYLDIHEFMDSTKSCLPDARHRAILHSAFGCFIVERVFGTTRVNSDGRVYSTRDVAEQHCIEDVGFIPTMEMWLKDLPLQPWHSGGDRKFYKREILKEPDSSNQSVSDMTKTFQQGMKMFDLDNPLNIKDV